MLQPDHKALVGLKTVLLCTGLAIAYGLIHDQFSIRICPAYLMDYHPQIIPSDNPTVVALAWGVVATWWAGAFIGCILSMAALLGSWPCAPWKAVVRVAGANTILTGLCAASVALCIHVLPGNWCPSFVEESDPAFRHAFAVCWWMHTTSYFAGALSGIVGAVVLVARRWKLSVAEPAETASPRHP